MRAENEAQKRERDYREFHSKIEGFARSNSALNLLFRGCDGKSKIKSAFA
jgi:hypothetical protein